MTAQVPRPGATPSFFYDPLIRVLGRRSNYEAGAFVTSDIGLYDEILRAAGLDPDALPEGMNRIGKLPAGLNRNITLAFRNLYQYRLNAPLTIRGPKSGQWGLTEKGVARAVSIDGVTATPFPDLSVLYDPIVKVVGRLTRLVAGAIVQTRDVVRHVIMDFGYDPDNLPMRWRELKASNNLSLTFERVRWAIKALQDRKDNPPIERAGKGLVALTTTGLLLAQSLIVPTASLAQDEVTPPVVDEFNIEFVEPDEPLVVPKGPNLTSQWLDKHLRPAPGARESDLMRLLRTAVASKCTVSATCSKVDDHIQEFFAKLIRRNSLARHLEEGREITYTHLATYAVRSAYTDARNAGTEPVEREMYGARTEFERKNKAPDERRWAVQDPRAVFSDDESGRMVLMDMADTTYDPANTVEQRLHFEQVWSRIEERMARVKKPHAAKRYMGLLAKRLTGHSVREIAEAEGVSKNRASTMMQEARRTAKEAALTLEAPGRPT